MWGLYPWFEESGANLVHRDDLDGFRRLSPYGKVFLRIGDEGDYIRIGYGDHTFRVKPELFAPVPPIAFPIGTSITVRAANVDATIDAIEWHHRDAKPIYFVRRDGKRDSRRYSEAELVQRRG